MRIRPNFVGVFVLLLFVVFCENISPKKKTHRLRHPTRRKETLKYLNSVGDIELEDLGSYSKNRLTISGEEIKRIIPNAMEEIRPQKTLRKKRCKSCAQTDANPKIMATTERTKLMLLRKLKLYKPPVRKLSKEAKRQILHIVKGRQTRLDQRLAESLQQAETRKSEMRKTGQQYIKDARRKGGPRGVDVDRVAASGGKMLLLAKTAHCMQRQHPCWKNDSRMAAFDLRDLFASEIIQAELVFSVAHFNRSKNLNITISLVHGKQHHVEVIATVMKDLPRLTVSVNVKDIVAKWVRKRNRSIKLMVSTDQDDFQRVSLVPLQKDNLQGLAYLEIQPGRLKGNSRIRRSTTVTSQKLCDPSKPSNSCCLYPMTVSFKDLGWDWIIEPESITLNYCAGTCQGNHHPYWNAMSKLQPLKGVTKAPCCTPKKMGAISFLYNDNGGAVMLEEVPGIKVAECHCFY